MKEKNIFLNAIFKKNIHSNEKNIEMVSILLKIFQSFTTVYMDRDIYDIFVNDDADFPDDDPQEGLDWIENENDKEDEIPALETRKYRLSLIILDQTSYVVSRNCAGLCA